VRPIIEANGGTFRGDCARRRAWEGETFGRPAREPRFTTCVARAQSTVLAKSEYERGDLVIISHKDFIPSLAPLVAQRQAQGFTVAVID